MPCNYMLSPCIYVYVVQIHAFCKKWLKWSHALHYLPGKKIKYKYDAPHIICIISSNHGNNRLTCKAQTLYQFDNVKTKESTHNVSKNTCNNRLPVPISKQYDNQQRNNSS